MIPGDVKWMLGDLLKLARRTERNFRQNISFSILVTVTLVMPLSMVSMMPMGRCSGARVVGHSVILNGARLAEGTGTLTLVKNTHRCERHVSPLKQTETTS